MKKLVCPVCGKEVNYKIDKKEINYTKDNLSFTYYEKVAICENCGEELYSDELQVENQIAFENAYKEHNQIISNEQIEEILKKYSITKRNLPLVLDLGELTITRYLSGYVPSKKISDFLKQILDDPLLYKNYLEKNKSKLKENIYARTYNKVTNLLGLGPFDEKLEECAEYIISKNIETSNLVLIKLLYFVDVFSRILLNKNLFNSPVKAWTHGPVYGQIYYEYKNYGNNPIEKENNKFDLLSAEEKELIDEIIKNFGLYSGNVLTYFTHRDGPWQNTRNLGKDVIPNEELDEYANQIKVEYKISNLKDIHKYSEALFEMFKKEYN